MHVPDLVHRANHKRPGAYGRARRNGLSLIVSPVDDGVGTILETRTGEPGPNFRHREAPSNNELFFDLFFVANLTTFTAAHEIDNLDALKSYLGFFTILWFTWLQVTLFDVRFGVDSLFERVTRMMHFGVMLGFAIVGPGFFLDANDISYPSLQHMAMILMVSRSVLLLQYGTVLLFTWKYKHVRTPMALKMSGLFVAAAIYLGLYFNLDGTHYFTGHVAFYVTAVAETSMLFIVSNRWDVLGFQYTCLVDRLGGLTLIILGEGIIGISQALYTISTSTVYIVQTFIAVTIGAVAIIYFTYLLYFDQSEVEKTHPTREHLWAILHFPLHIGLILLVEGISAFVVWPIALEVAGTQTPYFSPFDSLPTLANLTMEWTSIVTNMSLVIPGISDPPSFVLNALNEVINSPNSTYAVEGPPLSDLESAIFAWILGDYKVALDLKQKYNVTEMIKEVGSTYNLVYEYFFLAAGLTLVMLAMLLFLGKKGKTVGEYSSIALRCVIGTGLCLFVLMDTLQDSSWNNYAIGTDYYAFQSSAGVLPAVMLGYLFVLFGDRFLIWRFPQRIRMRNEYGKRRPSLYTPSKEAPAICEEDTDSEPFQDSKSFSTRVEEVPAYSKYSDDVDRNPC